MPNDNVVVVTRVRPFNDREKQQNSVCIVAMDTDTSVDLVNPAKQDKPHKFNFDHCYWSHDQSKPQVTNQQVFRPPATTSGCLPSWQVFEQVGGRVLENAFKGYNATVFAYGQTGSGKTFTMSGSETSGERTVDMTIVEVYKEKVYNLLPAEGAARSCSPEPTRGPKNTAKSATGTRTIQVTPAKQRGGRAEATPLKVRQHPERGTFIEGLTEHRVTDWASIETLMDQAGKARRTAQTKMNSVSSRSHSIVMLTIAETAGTGLSSKVCLVDLAGSERPSEASGGDSERFKEGIEINKSLTALGNVIHALAERANHVPYRDSVLTLLLRDSLGGTAKTIMIAALSPASINHDETLSTLRYADRAKQIVNRAQVNEDPTQRLIAELKAEIVRLKKEVNRLGGSEAMEDQWQDATGCESSAGNGSSECCGCIVCHKKCTCIIC